MNNKSIQSMWERYQKHYPAAPKYYEAWSFGDSKETADELANLVLQGTKTATASNYLLYEADEQLPYEGLHNIILDGAGKAVAVAVTTSVEVLPFDEVTKEHAYLEGEGDRSLTYWRKVHKDFFTREFNEVNQTFNDKIPVLCERLKVVFK